MVSCRSEHKRNCPQVGILGVARPNERLNRKLHEGDDPTYNKWHPSTVLRILNSSAYIGELVSGKTQTASYKGIGLHPVEKKEWHIVENAHEAIILKSDFEKCRHGGSRIRKNGKGRWLVPKQPERSVITIYREWFTVAAADAT